ncbi:MAG: response regulator [Nitrospira sp.]|nr:response regulator [Nitrospira sp.]MCP9461504.1 response regulator [Nitrospira sp.]MCP9473982.1 response regulator [Nitrospira sp.]
MPTPSSSEPSASTRTILLVSDEAAHAQLCRSFLEEAGFIVLRATGSSEALKVCARHDGPIHLLLTDLVLPPPEFQLASTANPFPHVNGFELAIRAAGTRRDLRVALMCKDPEKELAAHGIAHTKLPVLTKPINRQNLVSFVQEVLRQAPPMPSRANHAGTDHETKWFG